MEAVAHNVVVQKFVEGLPPAALEVLQLLNDHNKELQTRLQKRYRQIKQLKQVGLGYLVLSLVCCHARLAHVWSASCLHSMTAQLAALCMPQGQTNCVFCSVSRRPDVPDFP